MKNNELIEQIKIAAMNIGLIIVFMLVFSGIVTFVWNIGMLWLFPNFPNINYGQALALTVGLSVVHMIASFWVSKLTYAKNSKAIREALISSTNKNEDKDD